MQPFQPFDTWEDFVVIAVIFLFAQSYFPFVFYPLGAALLMVHQVPDPQQGEALRLHRSELNLNLGRIQVPLLT